MLSLALSLQLALARPAPLPGSTAPPVVLQRSDGGEVKLRLKGRAHLLVFFATWCRRCPAYLSHLTGYEGLRRHGVDLVAIDLQPSELPGDAQALWRRIGRRRPLYFDRYGQVAQAYGVSQLPAAVLVDRQGHIVGSLLGAQPKRSLERLLGELR